MPPVLSDTFGTRRVGLIFPKIFAVLNLSNLFANYATGWLRDRALGAGCGALAARVESDAAFEAAFGAPRDALPALVAAKTVTIPQLMRLVPDGTPDPSPFMHNEMLCARARRARAVVADEAAEALSPRRYALAGASALSLSLHMGALALGPYRPPAAARA